MHVQIKNYDFITFVFSRSTLHNMVCKKIQILVQPTALIKSSGFSEIITMVYTDKKHR